MEPNAVPQRRFPVGWAILAVIVVLGCGGVGLLFWTTNRDYERERGPAEAAAKSYMDAVLADDLAKAYSLTCQKIHRDMTPKEFEDFQSDRGQIARYEVTGFSYSSGSGGESGEIQTRMYGDHGGFFNQNIPLVKENGAWIVCE